VKFIQYLTGKSHIDLKRVLFTYIWLLWWVAKYPKARSFIKVHNDG